MHLRREMTPEEMAEQLRELAREVHTLQEQLRVVEARLPPAGWEAGNYICTANPRLAMCINVVTGEWAAWDTADLTPGNPVIAAGKTATGVAAKVKSILRAGKP